MNICNLIVIRNKLNFEKISQDKSLNIVIVNFHVFGSSMEDGIRC